LPRPRWGYKALLALPSFPCRTGKLREKIFRSCARGKKIMEIMILGVALGDNRKRGRETAGKEVLL